MHPYIPINRNTRGTEIMTTKKTIYTVEVRAEDRSWFTAAEADGVRTPEDADALVAVLRGRGFEARARLLD